MENKIKISKDLKFGYEDLMSEVDISQELTLRNILISCDNSEIPIDVLSRILRCDYIEDLIMEMDNTSEKVVNYEEGMEIDYLEVYWWGTKDVYNGVREDGNMWSLHGVGKLGQIPKDVKKYIKLTKKEKINYRSAMAVEFTPIYKLAHLPVKISKKLHITDYSVDFRKKNPESDVDFQPSITLIELLYAIFYELSFCGSPKQRDERLNSILKQVDEIKKASDEGRLDEITVPYSEVKKRLLAKIDSINKDKKKSKKSK